MRYRFFKKETCLSNDLLEFHLVNVGHRTEKVKASVDNIRGECKNELILYRNKKGTYKKYRTSIREHESKNELKLYMKLVFGDDENKNNELGIGIEVYANA